jgi:hypothetical protein
VEYPSGLSNVHHSDVTHAILIELMCIQTIFERYPPRTPQEDIKRISEPAERIEQLYEYCKTARSRQEMMDYLKLSDRKYFRENILFLLLILLFHNNSGTR